MTIFLITQHRSKECKQETTWKGVLCCRTQALHLLWTWHLELKRVPTRIKGAVSEALHCLLRGASPAVSDQLSISLSLLYQWQRSNQPLTTTPEPHSLNNRDVGPNTATYNICLYICPWICPILIYFICWCHLSLQFPLAAHFRSLLPVAQKNISPVLDWSSSCFTEHLLDLTSNILCFP